MVRKVRTRRCAPKGVGGSSVRKSDDIDDERVLYIIFAIFHTVAAATRSNMLRRLLPSAALRLQTHTPARSSAFRRMLCTARSSNDGGMQTHFRNSQSVHPLGIAKKRIETVEETGEWINPTTNHVWSEAEIKERLEFQPRHQPENLADRACIGFLKVAHLPCLISQGRASHGAIRCA